MTFRYAHLDPTAQAAARQWYLETYLWHDQDWCADVRAEWELKLEHLGFDYAKIAYSGFSSQGDGASFEAEVNAKRLRLPKPFRRELEANRIHAETVQRLDDREPLADVSVEFTRNRIRRSTAMRYVHANMIDCQLDWSLGNEITDDLTQRINAWINDHEKYLTSQARELSNEIYRDLETLWFEMTSDESIEDAIRECDFWFTEDGEETEPETELAEAA